VLAFASLGGLSFLPPSLFLLYFSRIDFFSPLAKWNGRHWPFRRRGLPDALPFPLPSAFLQSAAFPLLPLLVLLVCSVGFDQIEMK
jgi:hypothetical protein